MVLLSLLSRIRSPEAVRSLRWVRFVRSSSDISGIHDEELLCCFDFLVVDAWWFACQNSANDSSLCLSRSLLARDLTRAHPTRIHCERCKKQHESTKIGRKVTAPSGPVVSDFAGRPVSSDPDSTTSLCLVPLWSLKRKVLPFSHPQQESPCEEPKERQREMVHTANPVGLVQPEHQ